MKALLINGSPHEKGCTYTALTEVERGLREQGVDTEIFWTGDQALPPCSGCNACRQGLGKCRFTDCVNQLEARIDETDGFVFGSPVHFGGMSGNMVCFMDRFFYSTPRATLRYKPMAGIVCTRRSGASSAWEQLNQYLTVGETPIIARGWNTIHGTSPEEVRRDAEGMTCMRSVGRSMAYVIRCIAAGRAAGVPLPPQEPISLTNFIR